MYSCSLISTFILINLSIFLINCSLHDDEAMSYHFALPIDDYENLCQNNTCGDKGGAHTLCTQTLVVGENCEKFKEINTTNGIIRNWLLGHNGIRNKIAKHWDTANMNLLHWSAELSKMARIHLWRCPTGNQNDECDYIVQKNMTVGQNVLYIDHPPGHRFIGPIIRKWYLQIGTKIESFKDFEKYYSLDLKEFAQIIWPNIEFVGCAAAGMSKGFTVVCNYYPKVSLNFKDFKTNDPCTVCEPPRETCSRTFVNLCGIDSFNEQYSRGFRMYPEFHKIVLFQSFILVVLVKNIITYNYHCHL